jgi:hypothetical protein
VEVGGTCSSLFTRLPRYLWLLKAIRKDKTGFWFGKVECVI